MLRRRRRNCIVLSLFPRACFIFKIGKTCRGGWSSVPHCRIAQPTESRSYIYKEKHVMSEKIYRRRWTTIPTIGNRLLCYSFFSSLTRFPLNDINWWQVYKKGHYSVGRWSANVCTRTGLFNARENVLQLPTTWRATQTRHRLPAARIEVGLVSDFETGQRALYASADFTQFYKYNWV